MFETVSEVIFSSNTGATIQIFSYASFWGLSEDAPLSFYDSAL